MKRLLTLSLFFFFFLSCENIINTNTNFTVRNATSEVQTFNLHDSVTNEVKRSYSISPGETKTYTISRGYTKSSIKYCYWTYENSTWVINKHLPLITSIKNDLGFEIKLKDRTYENFEQTINVGNSYVKDFWADDRNSFYLDGQQTNPGDRRIYINDTNGDPVFFELFRDVQTKILHIKVK